MGRDNMTEQEGFFMAMLLKPFVMIVLMLVVMILARLIMSRIPEGRVKRLLSRRIGP